MSSLKRDDNKKQRQIGVILAYILLFLNMLIGIILTPYIVSHLGKSEYGLYQTISSFANNLALLDFGIGTTIVKYLSKYNARGEDKLAKQALFTVLLQAILFAGIIWILGFCINGYIPTIYKKSLTDMEIARAQQMFMILTVNIGLTLFDHYFVGINSAYERFTFINLCKILKIILRVTLIYILLKTGKNAIVITAIDLSLTIAFLIIDASYAFLRLHVRITPCRLDKGTTIEIFLFGATIFLQVFVNQANSNVDKVILGIMTTTECVAVYSVAMQLFLIFSSLAAIISSVYLPYVTKTIQKLDEKEDTSFLVIGLGRKQFMIVGLAFCGFLILGRDFIRLWMGNGYEDAWLIALIIMVPSMVELTENVAESITLAKGKNGMRTCIIALAAIFNIVATVGLIKVMGYIGAPIATAMSYIFGYIIAVNIFYYKVLNIDVIKMFKGIYSKIWLCLSITLILSLPLLLFATQNVAVLILKGVYMCAIYAVTLYFLGMNEEEKGWILNIARKVSIIKRR